MGGGGGGGGGGLGAVTFRSPRKRAQRAAVQRRAHAAGIIKHIIIIRDHRTSSLVFRAARQINRTAPPAEGVPVPVGDRPFNKCAIAQLRLPAIGQLPRTQGRASLHSNPAERASISSATRGRVSRDPQSPIHLF